MPKASPKVMVNCENTSCNKEYQSTLYKVSKGINRFCCRKCCDISQTTSVDIECYNCSKLTKVIPSKLKKQKTFFCCHKCSTDYNAKKPKNRIQRECEFCQKEYEIKPYQEQTARFCSKVCLAAWQSIAFKGESSSVYVDRFEVECDWCKETLLRTKYKINNNKKYNFCNIICKREHHRNVFSQSEEFKGLMRIKMLEMLQNGTINTDTSPQRVINKLLKKMKIDYENEYVMDFYAFDNYLIKHNLFIEVMGTYWHCDRRLYDLIEYNIQMNRIVCDKAKSTLMKNKYNQNTLYLWEFDIENNPSLCEALIKKFVENKGIIDDYHSSGYALNREGELKILNRKVIPYMDMSREEISKYIETTLKEQRSQRQEEKHIKFHCEYCQKETDQLLIHYERNNRHFCSNDCKKIFFNHGKRFEYSCEICNKQVRLTAYRHKLILQGKQTNVFCSSSCLGKHNKSKVKENNPMYSQVQKKCNHCNKYYMVRKGRSVSSKFCSPACRQNGSRQRIIFNCEECGETNECNTTQYNRSKNHFCSHECANKYRKKEQNKIKYCEMCNKEMILPNSSTKRFCSIACQGVWQSEELRGEKSNRIKNRINHQS